MKDDYDYTMERIAFLAGQEHIAADERARRLHWDAQNDARTIEATATRMIGRFPAACGGRHHHGHTCDYCLVDDILRAARVLCARWSP